MNKITSENNFNKYLQSMRQLEQQQAELLSSILKDLEDQNVRQILQEILQDEIIHKAKLELLPIKC